MTGGTWSGRLKEATAVATAAAEMMALSLTEEEIEPELVLAVTAEGTASAADEVESLFEEEVDEEDIVEERDDKRLLSTESELLSIESRITPHKPLMLHAPFTSQVLSRGPQGSITDSRRWAKAMLLSASVAEY